MHDFTGIDDPAAQKRIARLKLIFNTARRLGIDRHLHFLANEAFKDSPVELAQRPVPRHIRFSFRAKGDGAIRVAFYRYTDAADTNSLDRLKKHTYKRVHHTPHGVGGTFSLTPEMATYSGEYTIAPGEWCAISFHREKSSEPATVADVSVVVVDE